MIQIPRIMIAAPKSGSGKTMVTCGLLSNWKEKYKLQAIKCGPDYIDPMFHRSVLGIPSKNLDTYFTDADTTRALFLQSAKTADFAVLEGVMGLYDGLGGTRREGSSYHLAQVTKTPVILLVDAHGMGKSLLALLRGFLDYDEDNLICGVLLNRISKAFYETIKPEIENALSLPVLGFLPRVEGASFESRHLGLVLPEELPELQRKLDLAAKAVRETIALEKIEQIAKKAEPLAEASGALRVPYLEEKQEEVTENPGKRVRIAVARDASFCFYYEDNLRLLEEAGAELVEFSPLKDKKLPEQTAGLLLGGGYPELYADKLSENRAMREEIKKAVEGGMPTLAECGGFLYLHETLTDMENKKYPMAGAIKAEAFYTGKLVRFGYVELQEKEAEFLPAQQVILGHEFHYFDSTDNGNSCIAKKTVSGRSWDCVHKKKNCWMGFAHLYYPSHPAFVQHFVACAKEYRLAAEKSCRRGSIESGEL